VLAFNRDRCYHLVLCLQLILFHYEGSIFNYMSMVHFQLDVCGFDVLEMSLLLFVAALVLLNFFLAVRPFKLK